MTLTQDERNKFAQYLEQCAHESEMLLEQMQSLGLPEVMCQLQQMETHSARFLAKKLRTTESVTLTGDSE
jgi:hypothetical protein